jgi:hypothetical protein
MNPNLTTKNDSKLDYLFADKEKNERRELIMGRRVMDEWNKSDQGNSMDCELFKAMLTIKIC